MEFDSNNFTVLEGKLLKYINFLYRYKVRYVILKKLSFEYYYIESYKNKKNSNDYENEDYKYVLAKRYGIDEIFTRRSSEDNCKFEVSIGIGKDLIFECKSEIERNKWIETINQCKTDYLISRYGSTRSSGKTPPESINEIVCNTCQTIVTATDDIMCYCTNCKYDTSLKIDADILKQRKLMLQEILDSIPKLKRVESKPKPKIRRARTLPAFSELPQKLQDKISNNSQPNSDASSASIEAENENAENNRHQLMPGYNESSVI